MNSLEEYDEDHDIDKEIDDKQRQMFRNLTVAHKSNLLVYTKDTARYTIMMCQ